MKKIAIMDTSIMSFNLGDQIIMESARKGLECITKNAFVVSMPTHSPLFHKYEFSLSGHDSFIQSLEKIDLKLVCGTNLIEKDMKKRKNSWNMHMLDTKFINDFVLVGVGTDSLPRVQNRYTAKLYDKLLSHKYIHSTRDEKTKQFLESLGFEAINTGCVTLWPLTKEHCSRIPCSKSDTVVFTLTDYCRDEKADKELINVLSTEYKKVVYWPQGIFDLEYLETIATNSNKFIVLNPSLEAYNDFLEKNDCDYIGTRLHAGIKAMQKSKRSLIISVDNRTVDMSQTYGYNYLDRSDMGSLKTRINCEFQTNINIDEAKINTFVRQFSAFTCADWSK